VARKSEGWKLRKRAGRPYEARFTVEGREWNIGLGTHDRDEARAKASRAYADAVRGTLAPQRSRPTMAEGQRLIDVAGAWLAGLTLDPRTIGCYEEYAIALAEAFPTLGACTPEAIAAWQARRLLEVKADTVRKQCSALRGILEHAFRANLVRDQIVVPSIPKSERGTAFSKPRRVAAEYLSPEECEAILAALPARSRGRYPIRARFVVAYETGLRPEFLDVLAVPLHYQPGTPRIWIPADDDKRRMGRWVPISELAAAELDAVAPASGLVFGKHDYRPHVHAAAERVLGETRAERFTMVHLRSARATHWLEETGNVPGVMRLLGWHRVETASRYVRGSDRAALAVVAESAQGRSRTGTPSRALVPETSASANSATWASCDPGQIPGTVCETIKNTE
jgi:site-specific recombinase XerC